MSSGESQRAQVREAKVKVLSGEWRESGRAGELGRGKGVESGESGGWKR